MNNILNYFIESGIALTVFSLFFILVLKQEKAFVFNRLYVLGSVGLSLVLPMIHFSFGAVPAGLVAGTIVLEAIELANPETAITGIFSSFFIQAYLIIVSLLLLRIIWKTSVLLMARGKSIPHHNYRLVQLANSTEAYTFWDTVYLGDQLTSEEKTLVLAHEQIHAREKHSLDILILEIVGALFWINPVYLLIKKIARTNHEYLADAHAINHCDKEVYVRTLASCSIKKHGFELAHSFHTISTLARIKMINQQNNKIMKIKQIVPFVIGLALVVVFGCEDTVDQLSGQDDQTAAQTIIDFQTSSIKEAEGMDGVYDMVEEQPDPVNGMASFYEWVSQTLLYPKQAREKGIEGRVFVQFIVDETGTITEVKALKGIGGGCDEAAVELIKTAEKWIPGKIEGKPVSVRMIIPISFHLNG